MRIESSLLAYQASHRLAEEHTVVERTITVRPPAPARDTIALSAVSLSSAPVHSTQSAAAGTVGVREDLQELDAKQQLAVLALEALIGHRVRWTRGSGTQEAARGNAGAQAAAVQVRHRVETHSESERTVVQAAGVVETADGRSIAFTASLDMRREYFSQTATTSVVQATDPLIVNLDGGPARLTAARIRFDLDGDGTEEEVSFVAPGSAFLALDANQDGRINDGRELFGPRSGDGFAELAAYDADGNQWIDEADPVYERLQLWSRAGLQTLRQAGVGAISVNAAETPFSIKDSNNQLQGQIRATAAYLHEDGRAGTIQQVDLAAVEPEQSPARP